MLINILLLFYELNKMARRKKDEVDGLTAVLTLIIGCIYFPIKIIIVFIQIMILGISLIIKGIMKLTYWINEKKITNIIFQINLKLKQ